MRRRHLIAVIGLVALVVIAVPALSAVTRGAHTTAAKIAVQPAVGTPQTRFAVTFLTPGHAGRAGGLATSYVVSASDRRQRGCASDTSATIASPLPGARLKLWLEPRGAAIWCAGTFKGRILEYRTPVCRPFQACPQFILFEGTVAKFSFRVKRGG